MENLKEWRKKYKEFGIPTFPTKGKDALIKWKKLQNELPADNEIETTDYHSATGIAGVAGAFSGIIVIDCDIKDKNKRCDPEIIKRLKSEEHPETLTASGGSHFIVKFDASLGLKTQSGILPGLDIKTTGGCFTLPPSIGLYGQDELEYAHYNGNEYKWVKEFKREELKPFPTWLFDLIKSQNPKFRNSDTKEKLNYSEAMKGATMGNRNDLAVKVIGKYLSGAKSEEDFEIAWEAVRIWNTQNQPPIEESELKEKFNYYKNKEEAKKNKSTGDVFTRIGQAELFIKKQPIYFSPEGLLWFWNFNRYCYELKDEVDLLNGIRKEMPIDTINSKTKTEILAALKQVGREQAPKTKPKGWIQFNDILVNPKTGERIKADHRYFLTNPIPHKLGESEEIPEIDKRLREWVIKVDVQDESYVQSLYECVAYSLTDDLFMQRIIALTGGGSNGKGTFLKIIERLNGRDNCVSVDMKKLSYNNFAMSSVYKKLVAFAGEVGYSDLTSTNVLKKITGEDLIEYEFKGKTSFTDDCITTFFIATNSLPTSPDRSLGFYRRWVIIDFPNTFGIKADILAGISEQEYENLCLKSVNILKKLYETHKFTNEGNYEEREQKYEARSNPLPTFIEENCEETEDENIKLRDFGNNFNLWLKSKKLRVVNIIQTGKMLRALGYETGKRKMGENSFVAVLNMKFKLDTTRTTKTTED